MNRLKAVLQSKSANAPPRRNANKKCWSSGEVTRVVSKRRGVYVDKKCTYAAKPKETKPKIKMRSTMERVNAEDTGTSTHRRNTEACLAPDCGGRVVASQADKQALPHYWKDRSAITARSAGQQPIAAKRPPKNQKEFLTSVLNILSQETAGTQFPEDNTQVNRVASIKRVRVRKRIPVATADMGTQDLDAVYDNSLKDNCSTPSSALLSDANKPTRKKRFRSRALKSYVNETPQLTEPVTVSKPNQGAEQCTSSKTNILSKAVLDGLKLIGSNHTHIESTPSGPPPDPDEYTSQVVTQPPAANPPGEKPKRSKVRILEPLKKYEDYTESDKNEATKNKSNYQFNEPRSAIEVNVLQQENPYNYNSEVSETTQDEFNGIAQSSRREGKKSSTKQKDFYFPLPVIDVDDDRKIRDFDASDLNKVEVYTPYTRRPNKPKVTFQKNYEDYARVCNMRSKSFNHAAREKFEVRQSKLSTRTRVFINQNRKKTTKYKNKGKNHPLFEELKRDLSLGPDWFDEPDNMHDALLKVMDEKRHAQQGIRFPTPSFGLRDNNQQSESMAKGKKRRISPEVRKVYKPKAIGNAKITSNPHHKYDYRFNEINESLSVIRAEVTPDEEYGLLYRPLEAAPSLSVQNYDNDAETALRRLYMFKNLEKIDPGTSKEFLQSSAKQQQYKDNNYYTEQAHESESSFSTITSNATVHLLMSPTALDI